jgi:hypothetical protein
VEERGMGGISLLPVLSLRELLDSCGREGGREGSALFYSPVAKGIKGIIRFLWKRGVSPLPVLPLRKGY